MRMLKQLAQDERTTVIIASHDDRLRAISDRVLWLEDGAIQQLSGLVADPNCGMLVNPDQASRGRIGDGEELMFCSAGCRAEYLAAHRGVAT